MSYTFLFFFFFNDTATTEIYTLSLHDALPIFPADRARRVVEDLLRFGELRPLWTGARLLTVDAELARRDRKSTRLNSSHGYISYAVFCLKKKKSKNKKSNPVHIQHRPRASMVD